MEKKKWRYYNKETLTKDFYAFNEKHGRFPHAEEFKGADAIRKGKFSKEVHDFEGFIIALGEEKNCPWIVPALPVEALEAAVGECYEEFERLPLRKELEHKFPGIVNEVRRKFYLILWPEIPIPLTIAMITTAGRPSFILIKYWKP